MNEHERRALNEALFRDVNERIAESAEGFGADEYGEAHAMTMTLADFRRWFARHEAAFLID